MSIARKLIKTYRSVQYAVCGRATYGVMKQGQPCHIEPFKEDVNHGDVVHPCVRYIPEGYEGHCWWLVYTPYYNADASMENPILCYAESNEPVPPTDWKVYCEVKGKPKKGYNSDPVLLYDGGKLFVFWREYGTEGCERSGHKVATFGGIVKDGKIADEFGPVVWSDDMEIDKEVSPTFILKDDSYLCLAMHLQFHSKWIKRQSNLLKGFMTKLLSVTDVLGLGSQQKSFGIARWFSNNIDKPFRYRDTVKFKNCNSLYRPWHMDFFEYQGRLFAIVQTNQCNADLCLAYSEDYEYFTFYSKPLVTNASIDKLGIYKPTAGVVDNNFFLYYTAQDKDNRSLNKLYLTGMDMNSLLERLKK
jgi:hypothetical protein